MKKCLNCGHVNPEGVMFCERCGVALGAISLSTKQLNEDENDLDAGGKKLGEDNIIFLYVKGFDDPITVQLREEVVLGRGEGDGDNSVVNLENFGASDYGVSRQHSKLKRDGQLLQISDMGSTNHTYVNGQEVPVEQWETLRDGDEIRLGRLSLRVFFK